MSTLNLSAHKTLKMNGGNICSLTGSKKCWEGSYICGLCCNPTNHDLVRDYLKDPDNLPMGRINTYLKSMKSIDYNRKGLHQLGRIRIVYRHLRKLEDNFTTKEDMIKAFEYKSSHHHSGASKLHKATKHWYYKEINPVKHKERENKEFSSVKRKADEKKVANPVRKRARKVRPTKHNGKQREPFVVVRGYYSEGFTTNTILC